MTLETATTRLKNGDMLFVHTPAPPHEKFYFFAPDFETVSLPIGRRLRGLDGVVMLIKETPGHPGAPYFYWKLADQVTRDEAQASSALFCEHHRFKDARALKDALPHHFTHHEADHGHRFPRAPRSGRPPWPELSKPTPTKIARNHQESGQRWRFRTVACPAP